MEQGLPKSDDATSVKKRKKPAPVHSRQSTSEAFVTVLQHNFDYLQEWEEPARSWEDTEGVHQMRIAFRRMRSALATFRTAVPQELTHTWSQEMRWLAGQLGDARDLDVFIGEALGAVAGKLQLEGQKELLALIQARRAAAYDKVRSMLDSERYTVFKKGFSKWLNDESWLHEDIGRKKQKRLHSNIVPFSRTVLDKLERKVLARGSQIDVNAQDEMHQLRIECKKLRYAAEFFSPIFNGMVEFIAHMRSLQDLLGVMNDVRVMPNLLEGLFTNSSDRKAAEYAGGVVGWRTREYYELLNTFDDRWNEFVNAKHPWWKKSAIVR